MSIPLRLVGPSARDSQTLRPLLGGPNHHDIRFNGSGRHQPLGTEQQVRSEEYDPDPNERLSQFRRLERCRKRMIENGWCSHRAAYLARTCDIDTFDYLSSLACRRLENHEQCKAKPSCVAYNVDNETYRTQHVREECACDFIETPYVELRQIIQKGGIPLVSIEQDANSTYRLRVHERSRRSNYVAITHVWADGLGNPSKCALPTCQLGRLKDAVSKLASSGVFTKRSLFWMDTLCIPVDNVALRLAQIDKMASIYKGAAISLVLDAELMSTNAGYRRADKDFNLETYARIVCSVWNSRSWTYQESFLPPKLAIHFSGNTIALLKRRKLIRYRSGSLSAPERYGSPSTSVPDPLQEPVALKSSERTKRMQNILRDKCFLANKVNGRDHARTFQSAWNDLAGRSTTKAEDIPLIVSNILNFDNGTLLSYDLPEERYQTILLSRWVIPLSIFSNFGPRCAMEDQDLNRWVPTSISAHLLTSKASFKIHRKHFSLQYSGKRGDPKICVYMLHSDDWPLGQSCVQFSDDEEALYTLQAADLSPTKRTRLCVIIEKEDDCSEWPLVRRGSCFAVVDGPKTWFPALHTWQRPIHTIVFKGPVRFGQQRGILYNSGRDIRRFDLVRNYIELRALYERLPGVKPLRERGQFRVLWVKLGMPLLFATVALVCIAFGIIAGVGKDRDPYKFWNPIHVGYWTDPFWTIWGILLTIAIIGVVLLSLLITWCAVPWANWTHIRSFEEIANSRRQGEV